MSSGKKKPKTFVGYHPPQTCSHHEDISSCKQDSRINNGEKCQKERKPERRPLPIKLTRSPECLAASKAVSNDNRYPVRSRFPLKLFLDFSSHSGVPLARSSSAPTCAALRGLARR